MSNGYGERFAGIRKRTLVMAALMASLSLIALIAASSAMAAPVFERFAQCPTEVPGVSLCQFAKTTSGEVAIGSTTVPITKPIIVQGGAIKTENPEQPREYFLVPAKNGESMSKTALNVPGGLAGLINCTEITGEGLLEKAARAACKLTFESKLTGVTATTELVANEHNPAILNTHNLAEEEGTALTLPVRIHLSNPFLGNKCYIGSEANPVELHLTTGKSGSATGNRGEAETLEENGLVALHIFENRLVDNTFSVPVTEGCGELLFVTGFLDPIVNAKLGLPSKAGNNTAKLEGEVNSATAEAVIASGF